MNKIKTAKLLQTDGSVSSEIPLGVDAKDVDMKNGAVLQDVIGTINPSSEGSIKQQLDNIRTRLSNIESRLSSLGV